MHREFTIESAFYTKLLRWAVKAKVGVEVVKLNLVGRRGWPDRMIMWEGENILFVEFKRPGEVARPLQEYVHQNLRKMGFEVVVFDSAVEALEYVQTKIRTTTLTVESIEAFNERGWD